ncbi:hypothetical protein L6R46_04335, partial [Myxococcota bacterium]|nr:hypothetical protein [Myxococcota bacterium]
GRARRGLHRRRLVELVEASPARRRGLHRRGLVELVEAFTGGAWSSSSRPHRRGVEASGGA